MSFARGKCRLALYCTQFCRNGDGVLFTVAYYLHKKTCRSSGKEVISNQTDPIPATGLQ